MKYGDKPNYEFIRAKLKDLLNSEIMKINVSDNYLETYLTNNFLDFSHQFKDSTRNTTGYLSNQINNFLLIENFQNSNPTFIQNNNLFNNNEQNAKNEILKKKRSRNPDKENKKNLSKFSTKNEENIQQINQNMYNNYINNNNNNNNLYSDCLNQLIYNDLNLIEAINYNISNINVLKLIENGLYSKSKFFF